MTQIGVGTKRTRVINEDFLTGMLVLLLSSNTEIRAK